MKIHIKKGDTVYVQTGVNKGQKAKVVFVYKKTYKALVEGVNIVKKHTKPNTTKNTKGGILDKEAPIHISNLMLLDPRSGEPTRIGKMLDKNNKSIRYSKKSEEEIK